MKNQHEKEAIMKRRSFFQTLGGLIGAVTFGKLCGTDEYRWKTVGDSTSRLKPRGVFDPEDIRRSLAETHIPWFRGAHGWIPLASNIEDWKKYP